MATATKTNWEELEAGEAHGVFAYTRGDAECWIWEQCGKYSVVANRLAAPHKKTSKPITREQAVAMAAQVRGMADCTITFDHGRI